MKVLNEKLIKRFHRNIIIPEIGEKGQSKLLESSVLVIGCGGLGSASLLYLAAAGIGRIGLVDSDQVEISNLQRQVIHNENNLGANKTRSAALKLKEFFPEVTLEEYNERLTSHNCRDIFSRYQVILDASDNFPTRYLMNHTAYLENKPIIMGAVLGFSGQVTTIIPDKTPCYSCLFPQAPPASFLAGEHKVLGILGTSPGLIGMIQATEAIKLLLNAGRLLEGKLLLYDGLNMTFDSISYDKNKECCVCGSQKTDNLARWEENHNKG